MGAASEARPGRGDFFRRHTVTQIIQYRDDMVRCFIDTEFYEDGETIDLISLGAVRSDGEEFYAVNQEAKLHRVSPWVRENVLPKLPPYSSPEWMTRKEIADGFARLMSPSKYDPYDKSPGVDEVWGYYADYDWIVICQLYGTMMKLPATFPRYCLDLKQLSWMLGNPKHPADPPGEHNALEDARWNRDLYQFLRTVPSGVWGYGR
jgi:3'-5' exoribonuclease-like protein